jgi:hypothetical protein
MFYALRHNSLVNTRNFINKKYNLSTISDSNGSGSRSARQERGRREDNSSRQEDDLTDDDEVRVSENTRHSTPHPSPGNPSRFFETTADP